MLISITQNSAWHTFGTQEIGVNQAKYVFLKKKRKKIIITRIFEETRDVEEEKLQMVIKLGCNKAN